MSTGSALPHPPRPRVIANFALTLDGKVSTRNHTPSLFTSPRDKQRLLEIRSLGDALLVGRTTVAADTMSMGLPDEALRRQRLDRGQAEFPLRVVISERGRFEVNWKIFHSPGGRVVLFCGHPISPDLHSSLEEMKGVDLQVLQEFSVARVLQLLQAEHRVSSVVCEGGPTLLRSLLAIDALDEIYITFAPRVFGGAQAPTLTGTGLEFLSTTRSFLLQDIYLESGEVYAHYQRNNEPTC
jgi:riboflavin-specific deaminase-like protein